MNFDNEKLEKCKKLLEDKSISIVAIASLISYDNNTNNEERSANLNLLYHFREAAREVNIDKKVKECINDSIKTLEKEIRRHGK